MWKKLLPYTKSHWNRAIRFLKWRPVRRLEFYKFSYLAMTVTEFQIGNFAYEISSDDFSFMYGDFTICNMAAVGHLEFSKFRVCHVTYRHAILISCAKFHWSRTMRSWVMAKKTNGGHSPSWILIIFIQYTIMSIWSSGCSRVPNAQSCTQFYQNRMIFRRDTAISRFSRWPISAIFYFMGPIMGSLKSPWRTSYTQVVNRDHSSKLLLFWENHVFVRLLAIGGLDRQLDEQMDSPDALKRSRCRRLNKISQCVF